jgi:hypothetical protein
LKPHCEAAFTQFGSVMKGMGSLCSGVADIAPVCLRPDAAQVPQPQDQFLCELLFRPC